MPPDPAVVLEAREWLRRAAQDLRGADIDLAADPPLLEDVVFHAQQTVEKALKGLLVWHGKTFRKTHSLEELGEQCLAIDGTLRPLIDRAVPLTEYAWRFRYPGDGEAPTPAEAHEALAIARDVFDAVTTRLPPVP